MIESVYLQQIYNAYKNGQLILLEVNKFILEPEENSSKYRTLSSAFMLPIEGHARITLNDKHYSIVPGNLLYIPFGVNIQIDVLSKDYSYINIFHQIPIQFEFALNIKSNYEQLQGLFHQLLQRREKQNIEHSTYEINHILSNIFKILLLYHTDGLSDNRKNFEHLCSYLKMNYDKEITLDILGSLIHKSPSHVSYLFHKYENKRPIDYLIQIRIQKARELLAATQLSIAEVSSSISYQDPYYFSRLFKKHCGVSPQKFREGIRVTNPIN